MLSIYHAFKICYGQNYAGIRNIGLCLIPAHSIVIHQIKDRKFNVALASKMITNVIEYPFSKLYIWLWLTVW